MGDKSTNRWWENYLVRYLMPSIAGVIIINWLSLNLNENFRKTIMFGLDKGNINTAGAVLLFAYGNLFCYIASFPILVFHGTRAIDGNFRNLLRYKLWNGYFWFVIVGLLAYLINSNINRWTQLIVLILALAYSGLQLIRVYVSLRDIIIFPPGYKEGATPVFIFKMLIANKRTVKCYKPNVGEPYINEAWKDQFVESYKHLREHGNSAFIFMHELVFAALCYLVLHEDNGSNVNWDGFVLLLAIWVIPSVFMHCAGQHVERVFSNIDRVIP